MQIRRMTRDDVPAALAVYQSVGWGDRSSQLHFYLDREDSRLFIAENRGEICGCGGATAFGPRASGARRTGWVHLIAVPPEHRGRGAGHGVTEAAARWLLDSGVATVMLLATDLGRPIYERIGFRPEARYAVFRETPAGGALGESGTAPPESDPGGRLSVRPATAADVPALLRLDRAATGEDRSAILSALSGSAWVAERRDVGAVSATSQDIAGFHIRCPWGMGPTLAEDGAAGRTLLALVRRLSAPRDMLLSVPERNEAALAHLREWGLEPARYLTRMWLGDPPPAWRPERIFGVINNGLG